MVQRNLIYIIITVIVVMLSTRVFTINTGHLLAFFVSGLIVYYLQTSRDQDDLDFNATMEYRLEALGAPSHFHLDTNLINLFYNILPWRKLNANNFDQALSSVNTVLKIEKDTNQTVEMCVGNYEVAFDNSKLAMNFVHSFVYSIDHPLMVKKLRNVLQRLQQLLERHLDRIRDNCDKQENAKPTRNILSRFIEDAKDVKAFDPQRLSPFDYY